MIAIPPDKREQRYLLDALTAALGQMPDPFVALWAGQLEENLSAFFSGAHAIAVSSGTAALHTALACAGIGPGDEVLLPALTVVMSAAPILIAGARPVFV